MVLGDQEASLRLSGQAWRLHWQEILQVASDFIREEARRCSMRYAISQTLQFAVELLSFPSEKVIPNAGRGVRGLNRIRGWSGRETGGEPLRQRVSI